MKKFIAASASAAVVASAVAVPASAATSEFHPFKDVSSNYEDAISFLYLNDFIKGTSATTFGITQNLTRGDAAVILAKSLDLDTTSAPDAGFKDLNSRVRGAVNALADAGIVSGIDKDTFAPDKPLTRGAMAKILVLGFELEGFEVEEVPFKDAVGAFAPYINALYGTGITSGKSKTEYGKDLLITRGDFSNLLFNSFMFIIDNLSVVDSAEVVSSTSFKVNFTEPVIEELSINDVIDYLGIEVELADGTTSTLSVSNATLSADKKTLTVEHADLVGKEGFINIADYPLDFDFAAPIAGKGQILLEGSTEPVPFDFAGKTVASVELTGTDQIANLNGIEFMVEDFSLATDDVNVILKSTTVEQAKAGEGQLWGTLEYKDGQWALVDNPVYDIIPAGEYVLEAPFKDELNHTTTLTLTVIVK